MKYKWKLEFLLKNGERLIGYYYGEETNSDAVARSILKGNNDTFTGCKGSTGYSNLLVRVGEIAALDIIPFGEVKK